MYDLIQFNKKTLLVGEEFDWDIEGVTADIYASISPGDIIAGKFCENEKTIFTYNQNYDYEEAMSDNFSPFIIFYNVNKNNFSIIKTGLKKEECHEFETQNYNHFSYKRPKTRLNTSIKQ